MIKDSYTKLFDTIIVWKLDRFARNRYDSAHYKNILKKNGVKVISATEQIANTPEGIILEGMLESFAEYYSAELSQKVKRGLKESRIKGNFTGGALPYGYSKQDKKISIDEEQANIVRFIFNQYISGKIIKDIVSLLWEQGITNNYGKDWTINSVSRVLRNENYKGVVLNERN
jgi:DNA invertase Pin-like site-specific DNA recombinase